MVDTRAVADFVRSLEDEHSTLNLTPPEFYLSANGQHVEVNNAMDATPPALLEKVRTMIELAEEHANIELIKEASAQFHEWTETGSLEHEDCS